MADNFSKDTETPRVWRSLAERDNGARYRAERVGEFLHGADEPPQPPGESNSVSRRRFLALAGVTAALAGASCSNSSDGGIDRGEIVPYTERPDEVVPGVANYYASTVQEGLNAYSVLVKTREGRPIHVEGNDRHPHQRGKVSFRVQADIYSLYDPDRVRSPVVDGSVASWDQAQGRVIDALKRARSSGKSTLLVTGAVLSPSLQSLLEELRAAVPNLKHVSWEPTADFAGREAASAVFGSVLSPRYRFDKASVILSLENDFLGSHGNTSEAIAGFASGRKPKGTSHDSMNRLYVAESGLSLTGSNADHRFPVKASAAASLAFALARELNLKHGLSLPSKFDRGALRSFDISRFAKEHGLRESTLGNLAKDLAQAGEKALILAGPALSPEAHVACHLLHVMLGAEGHTVDTGYAGSTPEVTSPSEMARLADRMAAGSFETAIFWNVNPHYDLSAVQNWASALEQVPLRVRMGLVEDETAQSCQIFLPVHHWLESWGDYEQGQDLLTLQQPVIEPLHDSKQAEDILLSWLGELGGGSSKTYFAYLKKKWEERVFPTDSPVPFEWFWNASLHDGVHMRSAPKASSRVVDGDAITRAARSSAKTSSSTESGGFELTLNPDERVLDGRYANNGWLQEVPHPVNKMVWGNALSISRADARKKGLSQGAMVKLRADDAVINVPVLIQPGQKESTLSLSLGFGRRAGSVATGVGVNAYPVLSADSGTPYHRTNVRLEALGRVQKLVQTQDHHVMEGRDLARTVALGEIQGSSHHGSSESGHSEDAAGEHHDEHPTLYPKQEFPGHKWGMAIDMSACVGCSGCIVACQSENNIPSVGPENVATGREMHWIRIDRYYEGEPEDPRVVHQPILCQHCDSAPCENVCPVNATTHSPEGLNQMTYNRCVGTRYCANNCPYKVRRFNFYDYTGKTEEPLDLAYNPEVTVRPRGVMEKCTFCVQRIHEGKRSAHARGEPVKDGAIQPACQVSCPADAIVFGDLNDPKSAVSKLKKNPRGYKLLDELGVQPAVTYLASVRNPADGEGDHEV